MRSIANRFASAAMFELPSQRFSEWQSTQPTTLRSAIPEVGPTRRKVIVDTHGGSSPDGGTLFAARIRPRSVPRLTMSPVTSPRTLYLPFDLVPNLRVEGLLRTVKLRPMGSGDHCNQRSFVRSIETSSRHGRQTIFASIAEPSHQRSY